MVRINELSDNDFEYNIEPVVSILDIPQEIKYIINLNLLSNILFDQINVLVIVD